MAYVWPTGVLTYERLPDAGMLTIKATDEELRAIGLVEADPRDALNPPDSFRLLEGANDAARVDILMRQPDADCCLWSLPVWQVAHLLRRCSGTDRAQLVIHDYDESGSES